MGHDWQRTVRDWTNRISRLFAKESDDDVPRWVVDEALQRLEKMEAGGMESGINAEDVYDEDYPPGTQRRMDMDAKLAASLARHGRSLRRRQRVEAFHRKVRRVAGLAIAKVGLKGRNRMEDRSR